MVVVLVMSFKTVRLKGDQKFSASSALAADPALPAELPNYTHRYVLKGYVNTEGVYMDWDIQSFYQVKFLWKTYPKLVALSPYLR